MDNKSEYRNIEHEIIAAILGEDKISCIGDAGKIGYKMIIKVSNEEGAKIYCIDDTGKIRGRCMQKYNHYMSNWELWKDHKGLGKIIGNFEEKGLVFIIENKKIIQAKVLRIEEVDIGEMTSDPYMAGIFKKIFRPGTLN